MNTELHDIKTNIEIGEQIFEAVPSSLKPKWAGVILNKFNRYITEVPEIKELNEIIKKSNRWHEAHKQEPAPFDFDSGYHIPSLALMAANFFRMKGLRKI